MDKRIQDIAYFISFCIEQYKTAKMLSGAEAMRQLNKQNLIAELKTYKLVDQLLFHTEAALQTLSFIEAKEVQNELGN